MRFKYLLGSFVNLLWVSRFTYPFRINEYNLKYEIGSLANLLALKEIVLDGDYEWGKVRVDRNDHIIVDIGGGIGDFALMAATKSNGLVHTFEPDAGQANILKRNIKRNRLSNVILWQKKVTSLGEILNDIKETHIDFIKLDCEGCEFDLLNKKNISYLKWVRKISMECHENSVNKKETILKLLKLAGFKTKWAKNRGVRNLYFIWAWRN